MKNTDQINARIVSVANLDYCVGVGELRKQILHKINFNLKPGEIVILTGPSGSGKTTLLTLIGSLRTGGQGSIKVSGEEICGADENTLVSIRHSIGFIFQAHNLLDCLTARQNVRMALQLDEDISEVQAKKRTEEILEAVGLSDRMEHYPEKLSGGQRQRVAVARALVRRPKLILADEPTAALDSKSGRDVVNLMLDLAKKEGSAIILVTHDNRIMDIADRIVHMQDGMITGDSPSATAGGCFASLART